MTPRQMPLEKLTPEKRNELEKQLAEDIGKMEYRAEAEKDRRRDWTKAQEKIRKGISQTARKLREDDAIPQEEADHDRAESEAIAERILGDSDSRDGELVA